MPGIIQAISALTCHIAGDAVNAGFAGAVMRHDEALAGKNYIIISPECKNANLYYS